MTVGEAMERAEELRPGSRVAARTRQRWLCEVDGMLREKFFRPSSADSREGVGADIAWDNGLRDDDVLLVPPPFDSLYPHYLCAMTDAALGENDRYAGEQAQYNSILAELAAWLRRKNLPARGCSWRSLFYSLFNAGLIKLSVLFLFIILKYTRHLDLRTVLSKKFLKDSFCNEKKSYCQHNFCSIAM